ncbi:MAG: AraC family transcriptional regulator [Clostridiales bacterium]|nr:AraC family transcriptional regulator [Clostridiales bacterium]
MKQTTQSKQKVIAGQTRELLLHDLSRKITLAELADMSGYSATYLKICFKNVYGQPVHQYVRHKKLERAAELLIEGKAGVLDIAGQVGFENGSKFAKVFRDTFGMTPGKFRRLDKEEALALLEKVRIKEPKTA